MCVYTELPALHQESRFDSMSIAFVSKRYKSCWPREFIRSVAAFSPQVYLSVTYLLILKSFKNCTQQSKWHLNKTTPNRSCESKQETLKYGSIK